VKIVSILTFFFVRFRLFVEGGCRMSLYVRTLLLLLKLRCSADLDTIAPFEGPEKKIDIDFFANPSFPHGLRLVPRERWEKMLSLINCSILSFIQNDVCDAYLLSESSLFVYTHKVMIKTCGQITLLRCIDYLVKLGSEFCGASVAYINFSRRNFFFPEQQLQPHTSWEDEVLNFVFFTDIVQCAYLKSHFPDGDALIFGPRSCDHHYVFVADYRKGQEELIPERPYAGQTLEVLMCLNGNLMNCRF
jgi:S-adenosylmethionine decarboxylase